VEVSGRAVHSEKFLYIEVALYTGAKHNRRVASVGTARNSRYDNRSMAE